MTLSKDRQRISLCSLVISVGWVINDNLENFSTSRRLRESKIIKLKSFDTKLNKISSWWKESSLFAAQRDNITIYNFNCEFVHISINSLETFRGTKWFLRWSKIYSTLVRRNQFRSDVLSQLQLQTRVTNISPIRRVTCLLKSKISIYKIVTKLGACRHSGGEKNSIRMGKRG